MQYMYCVLQDEKTPKNSGITSEFNSYSAKRVDFIITGKDRIV